MTSSLLRVSVIADTRRVDVAVPPMLPVAELVPGLARRLGVVSYDGLRLCTSFGTVLDGAAGLAQQDVPDGAWLALAPEPSPPTIHDDPAEALARPTSPGPPGPAPGGPRPRLAATAAAFLLLLATVALADGGEPRSAAVVALLLLTLALGLGRSAPSCALVASGAACAFAAVAAGRTASELRPGVGVAWAAAGGAALAVATLATAGLPAQRLRLLPVLVVATAGTVVGAVLSVRVMPAAVLASALLVAVVALATAVPWLAAGRISRPRGRVDIGVLDAEARVARELMVGLGVGLAAVEVALVPVVAGAGPGGIALAVCACAITLLRARHHPSPFEVLPGLVAGGAGLLATAAVALWLHPSWRPVGALVLAGAGGVLLLVPLLSSGLLVTRSLLQAAETSCLLALVPLLAVAIRAWEVV